MICKTYKQLLILNTEYYCALSLLLFSVLQTCHDFQRFALLSAVNAWRRRLHLLPRLRASPIPQGLLQQNIGGADEIGARLGHLIPVTSNVMDEEEDFGLLLDEVHIMICNSEFCLSNVCSVSIFLAVKELTFVSLIMMLGPDQTESTNGKVTFANEIKSEV